MGLGSLSVQAALPTPIPPPTQRGTKQLQLLGPWLFIPDERGNRAHVNLPDGLGFPWTKGLNLQLGKGILCGERLKMFFKKYS